MKSQTTGTNVQEIYPKDYVQNNLDDLLSLTAESEEFCQRPSSERRNMTDFILSLKRHFSQDKPLDMVIR